MKLPIHPAPPRRTVRPGYDPTPLHLELEQRAMERREAERPELVLPLEWQREATHTHTHSCTNCYEREPCAMECSIEPDLYDPKYGQSGSHALCSRCEKTVPVSARPAEWT